MTVKSVLSLTVTATNSLSDAPKSGFLRGLAIMWTPKIYGQVGNITIKPMVLALSIWLTVIPAALWTALSI